MRNKKNKVKLYSNINNCLFNLLCCLVEECNLNNNLYQNCFLILAILNKILFDLGISEYIMIYESENIIQICKEKITNKIGILEDKNNILSLERFVRYQDIDFNNIEKIVELSMKKHSYYAKTHLNTVIKKIGSRKKIYEKINIKECCDSFTLNNFVNKNHFIFQIKNRKNQNFIYEKNLNDDSDYFIDNANIFIYNNS